LFYYQAKMYASLELAPPRGGAEKWVWVEGAVIVGALGMPRTYRLDEKKGFR
jgi:hypothetical protein